MLFVAGCSELEGDACHLHVFLFREFVFQRGQELRVDLEGEALDFLNDRSEVLVGVARASLEFTVPRMWFLKAFGRKN